MLAGRGLEIPWSCGNKHGSSQYLSHDGKKLSNWLDPAVKAMALILPLLLDKLKTHVIRKRYTIKNDSKTKKTSKWFTVC